MKGKIELIGMEFQAFHGCLPMERIQGAKFRVDFTCEADIAKSGQTDQLEDTLDYSAVYDIVAAQMTSPSNLIETVATRISDAIAEAFPQLEHFKVKIYKENPPVAGPAAWAAVELER